MVKSPSMNQDTIAAIITPPGIGAVSMIRISGPEAFAIIQKIFSKDLEKEPSHTIHYGRILDSDKNTIDSVLVILLRGPKSYTGEDSIEISCHGGNLVTQKVLQKVYDSGARPANPGEFSLRAYLNGKIDLAQAEAIQQLICAKNSLALGCAEKQLDGELSEKIRAFQTSITEIGAILEACLDFPEEGLEFATTEELCNQLQKIYSEMDVLKRTFHHGKMLNTGISLCLLGSPNAGKSSLMNALLKKERAIVTPKAGTTRDLLEEDLLLGNIHFRLIDTAGIRSTEEEIEQEGIRRAKQAMSEADLILLLLDASKPLSESDTALLKTTPKEKTVLVWNKIDLNEPPPLSWHTTACISAKEKIGIEALEKTLQEFLFKEGAPSKEEVIISSERHYRALDHAMNHIQSVIAGLENGVSPEFTTSDLRAALNELSTIIGANVTEEILSSIFSKFCLGK